MSQLFEKHDVRSVHVVLPLPPSVNEYMPTAIVHGKPVRYKSALAKEFIGLAKVAIYQQSCRPAFALTGPIRVTVRLWGRNRRQFDVDNRIKPLLDALTDLGFWLDDSQICELHVFRLPPAPPDGRCDVLIEAIPE